MRLGVSQDREPFRTLVISRDMEVPMDSVIGSKVLRNAHVTAPETPSSRVLHHSRFGGTIQQYTITRC